MEKDARFQKLAQILVILATLAAGFAGGANVLPPEDPPVAPCQCDEVVPDPEPTPPPKPEAVDPDGVAPIGVE
jgi:hypothetical protein